MHQAIACALVATPALAYITTGRIAAPAEHASDSRGDFNERSCPGQGQQGKLCDMPDVCRRVGSPRLQGMPGLWLPLWPGRAAHMQGYAAVIGQGHDTEAAPHTSNTDTAAQRQHARSCLGTLPSSADDSPACPSPRLKP